MEQSQTTFNIMNLLAQSVAKIEAMDELDVKNPKLKIKLPRTVDTASIVYHYLRVVSPEVAALLLDIHPEVDMKCAITLVEVVQEWKKIRDNKAVLNVTKYEDGVKDKVGINKDCTKGRKFVKDNSKALHTNKGKKKKTSLILDEDIENLGVKITKNPKGNKLSIKEEGKFEMKSSKETHKRRICRRAVQLYTPKEDSIILNKIKELGDDLNINELAKELERDKGSVRKRIKRLKSGDTGRKHKTFSLAEDEAIMERVLPGLQNSKLHELVLHYDKSLEELAAALGRPNKGASLALRWVHNLQPWIMRHYAGTLNLDIRMMLVNHLAETYQSRESIDWNAVADKAEFAGNTVTNLKHIFSYLIKKAKKPMKTEYSWKQIVDCCREYISQASRECTSFTKQRRIQVIQYFEDYVKRQELDDFL